MSTQLLNLPINIPWKQIAVSPDMMDTKFCNKKFPFAWRSSLAISAYEPKPEDLPEELCNERITYLKITCSITGYQPTKEEQNQIFVEFSDIPIEQLLQILEERSYFACYGVLLNVAVFPGAKIIKKYRDVDINFVQLPLEDVPNPLEISSVKFEAEGALENHGVDIFPEGGDNQRELDLQKKLTVTLPPSDQIEKVHAKVAHFGTKVSMEAFKGNNSVGSSVAQSDENTVHDHELLIESQEGIERVVFTVPEGSASLLEFGYSVVIEETSTIPEDLKDYPHIIDFEPKMRDLYQAATETGEVLTASNSKVATNKTLTQAESSETGISVSQQLRAGDEQAGASWTQGMTHNWGSTDQDSMSIQTDASRERRETQGTTTQLSQMYNLLTAYHQGTNRATFLMLPRPHVLQPTDHRTFVQGLRYIEGVQEFMLIVSRPYSVSGLCIEAFLETGHFPEGVEIVQPTEGYDTNEIVVTTEPIKVSNKPWYEGYGRNEKTFIKEFSGFEVDGWEFDPTQGEPGHGSVIEDARLPDDDASGTTNGPNGGEKPAIENYSYKTESPDKLIVSALLRSQYWEPTTFHRSFRVFLRKPKIITGEPQADLTKLLITSRGLYVCIRSGEECPEVIDFAMPCDSVVVAESIVDERQVKISRSVLTRQAIRETRTPAIKDTLRQIQKAMTGGWRLPTRYPAGVIKFIDSDYFAKLIGEVLPDRPRKRSLNEVKELPADVMKSLSKRFTVDEVLAMSLSVFALKTGLSIEEAAKVRRRLLTTAAEPTKSEEKEMPDESNNER